MKKFLTVVSFLMLGIATLAAQNYMVVDSRKIFEAYPAYTTAVTSLDNEAKSYQTKVDARFQIVEQQYNSYMKIRPSLNLTEQKQREATIQRLEGEATRYQESIFGDGGVIEQRQQSVLEPIQKRVIATIEQYAKVNGYDLVLDSATSPSILYRSTKIDCTNDIIKMLK